MNEQRTYIPRCGVLASVVAEDHFDHAVPRRGQVLVVRPGTALNEISLNGTDIAVYPEVAEYDGQLSLHFVPIAEHLAEFGQWLPAQVYLVSNAVLRAETQRLTGAFTLHHVLHDQPRPVADEPQSPIGRPA